MSRSARSLTLLLLLSFSLSAGASTGPGITEVSLFKNGLGYFVMEGEAPAGNAPLRLADLPRAVHGSYWFRHPAGAMTFRSLVATTETETATRTAASLAEVLEANVGKVVELRLGNEVRRGTIAAILREPSSFEPQPPPAFSSLPRPVSPVRPSTPNAVVFESGGSQEVISAGSIQGLRVEGALATGLPQPRTVSFLRLDYSAPRPVPFVVSYLGRGITWAPSYEIDITRADTARVRLKAEVINEASDLENVRLNFISGYPNLAFSAIDAPLTSSQGLDAFLSSLSGGGRGSWYGRREGVVTQQVMLNAAIYDSIGDAAPAYSGGYEGDLFFYGRDGVTLRRGEKAYFPLMEGDVPYRHVYTWKVSDSARGEIQRSGGSPEGAAEEVWHALKLTNAFAEPWTTAPAIVVSNERVLGQDVNYYTAPGGRTRLKITRAMEVAADGREFERERKNNAVTIRSHTYDQVTVEGILEIRNDKNEEVRLEISKLFEGSLVSSTGEPEVEKIAEGLRDANPRTQLEWEITLPARTRRELRYIYTVLVP